MNEQTQTALVLQVLAALDQTNRLTAATDRILMPNVVNATPRAKRVSRLLVEIGRKQESLLHALQAELLVEDALAPLATG